MQSHAHTHTSIICKTSLHINNMHRDIFLEKGSLHQNYKKKKTHSNHVKFINNRLTTNLDKTLQMVMKKTVTATGLA